MSGARWRILWLNGARSGSIFARWGWVGFGGDEWGSVGVSGGRWG